MKSSFQKQEPKILNYRNYKFFNNENFRSDLINAIGKLGFYKISCEKFESLFVATLNKHAPLKTRYVRANISPFMTNTIYKAIMMRTKLRNKFLRLKTAESRVAYNKQRNLCVSLIRNAKNIFMRISIQNLLQIAENFGNKLNLFSPIKHQIAQRLHFSRVIKLSMTIWLPRTFLIIILLMQWKTWILTGVCTLVIQVILLRM